MRRRETGGGQEHETREHAEMRIETNWQAVETHLIRRDPFGVVDAYRSVPPDTKNAIYWRIVDYLNRVLALPPHPQIPFEDDNEGLNRLIYVCWPVIPVRSFDVEDLPDLWQRIGDYDAQFRVPVQPAAGPDHSQQVLRRVRRVSDEMQG